MEIGLNVCRLCQKPTSIGVINLFENKDGIKYADQVLEMLNIEVCLSFAIIHPIQVLISSHFSSRTLLGGLPVGVAFAFISSTK